MSDRITVFNQGIIRRIDSPEALYERPASSFVASLIGENDASHGTVESVNGERCRVLLDSGAEVTATALPSGGVSRTDSRRAGHTTCFEKPYCKEKNMARISLPNRRVALRRRRHLQRWPPRRHAGHERRLAAADSDAETGRTDRALTEVTTQYLNRHPFGNHMKMVLAVIGQALNRFCLS